MESCGSHTSFRLRPAGGSCEPWHPAHTLALAGRYVVRPVDALTTATTRVVPFACACDDVWHSCSFIGVIGHSATPGACSLSPSLPPEAPSLGRHCPASTVVRASPPPWPARPCPHGRRLARATPPAGLPVLRPLPSSMRAAATTPGGAGRCLCRSLPGPWQPSPSNRRVGFRIIGFEACTAFRILQPAWSRSRPWQPFSIEVLQTMSLPPSSAPTVTGWSDSCRAGFAPAEERRLFTAHCSASTNVAGRVASFEDVTRHPQNDRTRCLGRIASRRHRRAEIRPPGGSAWTGSRRGAWRAPVPSPAVRRVSSRESSSTAGVPPFNAGLKATTAIEAAERAVCHPWMRHSRRSVTSRCATNCTRSPAGHLPGPSRGRTGVRGVLRSVT